MTRKPQDRPRLRGWGWLLLAGPAMAADEPYLQLEARLASEPYQWTLPDGEVVRKALADDAARIAVERRDGHDEYVLELLWGRFPVHVPPRCWQLPAASFKDCATVGPREESAFQHEQRETLHSRSEARRQIRNTRVAWVFDELHSDKVANLLEQAIADVRAGPGPAERPWAPDTFPCVRLPAELAAAPSQQSLPYAKLNEGDADAVATYAQAARDGNWRAGAGLFGTMMADEDWESAQVIVGWLLHKRVPAGYNKLADLLAAAGQYDGASMDPQALTLALRMRAASLGDPLAQYAVAEAWTKAGHQDAAERLRACAIEQNPALAR
ncbi:Rho GTPase-activating protein [Zestomonas carbonaria]|uniref:Sel1 repeat family protein n=1 Tax=Zestomonas carbonaria TaxID=2762745 RepID=A0A7U7I8T4_9GAMM|nr:hypothetical protein [Pseudomonas carbonaria]CAD5107605.1 hypothetical protein PSEWESI4_01878 [Pseudomonas carbonaria]